MHANSSTGLVESEQNEEKSMYILGVDVYEQFSVASNNYINHILRVFQI